VDDLGAIVSMANKTFDDWQGDEALFEKSFAAGKGDVFVDDVKFDGSSRTYLIQGSVPVTDGGKAFGGIPFGIDDDKVQ
jgi:hypothetical protein